MRHVFERLGVVCLLGRLAALSVGSLSAEDMHGMHGHGHDDHSRLIPDTETARHQQACCDNTDCRPTVARVVDNVVQVQLDGEWTPVPPEKILCDQALIYCVVLGSGV